MEPVRVKLYGIFSVTRRRYLVQQVTGLLMVALLFVVWFLLPRPDTILRRGAMDPSKVAIEGEAARPKPGTLADQLARMLRIIDYLPWLAGGLLLLIVLETTIVLRRFAEKEAAQQAALAPPPTAPPSATEPAQPPPGPVNECSD